MVAGKFPESSYTALGGTVIFSLILWAIVVVPTALIGLLFKSSHIARHGTHKGD